MVTNGGAATLTSIATGGRSNAVVVTGAGSVIVNNATVSFGNGGSSNALVFRDGGSMNRVLNMGGTNNHVQIERTTNGFRGLTLAGRSNVFELKDALIQATFFRIEQR